MEVCAVGGKGSGRISRPAKLKLIEGRSPGHDSGGRAVAPPPPFERCVPQAPAWLTGPALDEWHRVIAELSPLDLLKSADSQVLACYCQVVADHAAAVATLAAEGRVVANPTTGHQHPHPAVADARASRAQILQFAREFGLTPASEQRLAALPADDDDSVNPFAPQNDR
ncbi:hypothetical protein MSHI_18200 [Mycobacterium shinjukuense]|uniref:Terminase n=1 Tax=Mycobacterium shinjukuense TaxID=398694 RepID=A0A7I7MNT7_9MYCO|nr:hypothetical protein MSHI_18200 [Mycobacterium shinjukuense]